MHIDNKSAIVFAKNSVYHEKSKHIDTMYYFIREHANNKKVELHYVKSQDQEMDIIMKAYAVGVFNNIWDMFDLIEGRKLGLRQDVKN